MVESDDPIEVKDSEKLTLPEDSEPPKWYISRDDTYDDAETLLRDAKLSVDPENEVWNEFRHHVDEYVRVAGEVTGDQASRMYQVAKSYASPE